MKKNGKFARAVLAGSVVAALSPIAGAAVISGTTVYSDSFINTSGSPVLLNGQRLTPTFVLRQLGLGNGDRGRRRPGRAVYDPHRRGNGLRYQWGCRSQYNRGYQHDR